MSTDKRTTAGIISARKSTIFNRFAVFAVEFVIVGYLLNDLIQLNFADKLLYLITVSGKGRVHKQVK